MNGQLAQHIMKRLSKFGLSLLEPVNLAELSNGETAPATLAHEFGRATYRIGYADPFTASSLNRLNLDSRADERILLLGHKVTERSAEMFRQRGINYLDAAGNAFIVFDGVRIDVRGRPAHPRSGVQVPRATRGGVNLFSVKRSQVIFVVLSWPELLESPVREIAGAAGASLGQAQQTLELLTRHRFLDDRRRLMPQKRDRLIDQWTAAFSTGLGSDARTQMFSGDWHGFNPGATNVWLSGEAATPELLRPETVMLYTQEFPKELIRTNRWQRNDAQPNIFLREQFWQPKEAPLGPGPHKAPWLLIYADLFAANESRQREAAEQLRERHR